MSQGAIFSSNLAKLCAQETDVMTVCRATKINRQQFQRYLSGTVPYERNLEKICRYFGVKPQDMFVESGVGERDIEDKAWWSHVDMRQALKLVHSDTRPSIPSGLYYTYFAIPGHTATIARSATIVRTSGGLTTFRRLTGLAERSGSWWSQFFGDHKGMVIERAHWLYFVGINARGNREPTLITVRWLQGSKFILGGQAIVSGPMGPTATAVVIAPCGTGITLSTAIKASRAHSARDVDPLILGFLAEEAEALAQKTATLPGIMDGPGHATTGGAQRPPLPPQLPSPADRPEKPDQPHTGSGA